MHNWGHHYLFFSCSPAYCGRCLLGQKGPQPGSWSPRHSSRWSGPVGGWSNPHWTHLPLRQQDHLHGSTQHHPQKLSLSLWSRSKCKQKWKCGNLGYSLQQLTGHLVIHFWLNSKIACFSHIFIWHKNSLPICYSEFSLKICVQIHSNFIQGRIALWVSHWIIRGNDSFENWFV